MTLSRTFAPLLFAFTSLLAVAQAEVRLPGFFSDHMVLQQQKKILVWGWADAGEAVAVSIGTESRTTKAAADGTWRIELPAMTASKQAVSLSVKGAGNALELKDILIGEVWLCSGQSNMEWTVQASTNAKEEIAAANFPMIRHMKVAHRPSTQAMDDVESKWKICSPETAGSFTACGYFMARKLFQELDVPVGLVNSSWGGTRVEPWTTPAGFKQVPALAYIHESIMNRTPGTEAYNSVLLKHIDATEAWLATAKTAMQEDTELQPSPAYPSELTPFRSHQDPTMLYNGMIHALVGFPIRGAIWYQGESNRADGMEYFEKKKALIQGWRDIWGQGEFPFYFVQIAPYQYGQDDPTELARFWEAQEAVLTLPNTGMVVTNDIATLNDIHPPNKQDVGLRLANLALHNDYGKTDVVASSPQFASLRVLGEKLELTFKNTGGGLATRDDMPASHFEVTGVGSNGFQPATAEIDGDKVLLSSADVAAPLAFRFAWDKLAEPNLVGGTGLPLAACRGGRVPDFLDGIPEAKSYQLVYDLQLDKLQADSKYDIDNSRKIGDFDRIGYLVELESEAFGKQDVFVSVEAFTDDATQIGIPTKASKAHFQQPLKAMRIFSSDSRVTSGQGIATGNIEFWPNNYSGENGSDVLGASGSKFDFGDKPGEPRDGYGSMQIHNYGEGQTVFAINHWKQGKAADIGIGSSSGPNSDWTFKANAATYSKKRLRVFVRPK